LSIRNVSRLRNDKINKILDGDWYINNFISSFKL
jgi:hypothetical protein